MNKVKLLDVSSNEMKEGLKWLRDIAKNSYGPLSRLSMIRPFDGAVCTWTNRSGKILQLLKTSNAILKLVINISQQHAARYKDSGLFVTLLATNVILNGLELQLPRRKVAMATGYVFSMVTDWLCSEKCSCKRKLDITSSQDMMGFVKSCLCSKLTVYGVTDTQLNHLASLVLQGFLSVLPGKEMEHFSFSEHFHILPVLFLPLESSQLLSGLALTLTDKHLSKQLKSSSFQLRRNNEGGILTVLYNISLAGDIESCVSELKMTSEAGGDVFSVEDVVLEQLMKIFEQTIEMGVGMVGCQKVIHPLLKDYLREKGVLVVDRLSSQHISSVREVCGGKIISTLSFPLSSDSLGCLKDVRTVTVQGEEYLVLEGVSTVFCSLLLGCDSEQWVEEFAPICSSTVSLLEQSIGPGQQYVLCGGGCCETCISCYLLQQSNEPLPDSTILELECDQKTYSTVVKSIAAGFKQVATSLEHWGGEMLLDSLYHHCWNSPPLGYKDSDSVGLSCNCGAILKSQLPSHVSWDSFPVAQEEHMKHMDPLNGSLFVCDPFLAKVKAIEVTGDLVSTVLQTAFVISDT